MRLSSRNEENTNTSNSLPESHNSRSDDEDEEVLGSDDDEQEDPKDYCKGCKFVNRDIFPPVSFVNYDKMALWFD